MSPQNVFELVAVVGVIGPCVMAVATASILKRRGTLLRGAAGVTAGWIAGIVFTIYVYNPVGTAAAIAAGVDSPGMRYDNNTVTVAVVGGWLYPALAVAFALGIRAFLLRRIEQSGV